MSVKIKFPWASVVIFPEFVKPVEQFRLSNLKPPPDILRPPEMVEVAEVEVILNVFAWSPPANVEVAILPGILMLAPVNSNPPPKVEVAEDVTARDVVVALVAFSEVKVVEPKKELMLVARIFPPEIVSPFEELIPPD